MIRQKIISFPVDKEAKSKTVLYYCWQCGITCGAIDEPSRSSKAIDKRVIINFRDKNVVIARFRDKNVVIARFLRQKRGFCLFNDIYIYISIYFIYI